MSLRTIDDLGVMVAGQGGDGSLTLITLLSDVLGLRGFELYLSRNVASRVKGGTASGSLRASAVSRGGLGDVTDVLVAFDDAALALGAARLHAGSCVVHDSSDGPLAASKVPAGVAVVEIPFGRLAVRDHRRDLYKNSLAFGAVTRILGIPGDEAAAALKRSLAHLAPALVEANLSAMEQGVTAAGDALAAAGFAPWSLATLAPRHDGILISGNEAAAFGFLAAGGRFFAGYPITPASEILEWLQGELPRFGGVAVQAEDEMAAINLALGAALTGTRSMTASSGPGIALMQEGVSHLGSAEVGVVVVDCQRAGPSTGMPTKPEQSDIGMLVHGASGDFPRIALAPGDPADAFRLTAAAVDLAERFQGPVYVALDQAVSQDPTTVKRFDLGAVSIDRSAVLDADALAGLSEYRRYSLDTENEGISPWVPIGIPGGEHLVTGNEHDEWGLVSAESRNRVRMMDKRARKLETLRPQLPRGRGVGDPTATVGLVGFGMVTGPLREAVERLCADGHPVRGLQVLTLWPVLEDVRDLVAACRRVYVVEHNGGGQYRTVLAGAGLPAEKLVSILRYDGLAFRPAELVERVLAEERV